MQLGMIGLGRMGGNMAKRIAAAGHEVVGVRPLPRVGPHRGKPEGLVAALNGPASGVGHGAGR